MYQLTCFFRLGLLASMLLIASCTSSMLPAAGQPQSAAPTAAPAGTRVSDVEVLGVITVPFGTMAFDTPIGGLSAIAYDPAKESYFFLSDDRGAHGPVRIYQASVDVSDGRLDEGDLSWTGMIKLLDESGAPYPEGAIDPEGLVYAGEKFYVSTEGDLAPKPNVAPAIIEFTPSGEFVASLPVPEQFVDMEKGEHGVRDNQGFESLTLTPDGRMLISGVENALAQDGPKATLEKQSPSRLIQIDLSNNSVVTEAVYLVDAIPVAPKPAKGDADNGLAEMIALDNKGVLLALERSYAEGVGNTVRLYRVEMQGATDVSSLDALPKGGVEKPVSKERVLDFGELGRALGVAPDNLEGMALGPQLADGRRLLLVVSDNNFNPEQTTQVWALAIRIEE